MKKMMFLSKNWYFSVQKALIYYTFNKSHHNSFILLVFSHVANFRYVANFRFLTLYTLLATVLQQKRITIAEDNGISLTQKNYCEETVTFWQTYTVTGDTQRQRNDTECCGKAP